MPAASASPMPSDTSPSTIFLVLGSLMNLTVTGSRISKNRCTTKPAANGTVRVVARLVADRLVVARLSMRPPKLGPGIAAANSAARRWGPGAQWVRRGIEGKRDSGGVKTDE